MIPLTYSSRRPLRNLPKLLKAYNADGGSIVEFKRVVSCFVISRKSSHYVWVPPNKSPVVYSLPDTITTLLLGWWSVFGLFWTIEVLIGNLGGGRDATEELLHATGGGDVAVAQQAINNQVKAQRGQSVRALAQFAAIVIGIVLVFWMVAKISDTSLKSQAASAASRQNTSLRVAAKQMRPTPPSPAVVPAKEKPATTASAAPAAPLATPGTNSPAIARYAVRLQGVSFAPNGRSIAIINRSTVGIGESVDGYTLIAVGKDWVTVRSSEGSTNTLRLGY